MANLLNEAEIRNTWAPIIEEATGINESEKLAWMSTYCHNHKLYEDANIMSLSTNPGPMNLAGMGAVSFPSQVGNGANVGTNGSGDKAPTLLPLAMQVAAQTIGLDLVPVVPMAGPMGLLSYLDFTYEGGTLTNLSGTRGVTAPTIVKTAGAVGDDGNGNDYATSVGTSRLDGVAIYKISAAGQAFLDADSTKVVADLFGGATVELVKALEDHIPSFSGDASGNPMAREVGERTPDNIMGLSLFSKSVAAETFQVAAAVTREQVQDLKQFGVDAVAQVESVLTNELTQSINQHILGKLRSMAADHKTDAIAAGDLAAGGLDLTLNAGTNGGNTRGDEHRRILTTMLAAANLIANRGRRGAGNFAVVSAKVASALQGVAGFVPNPMANTFNQVAGAIYPVGSVAGINVYTDPTLAFGDANVLVGRKGDGNGPGVVFMPYLMAESVQTIAEGTMAPKVAVKSRYALVEAGFHPGTQYEKFELENFNL
jgi:hypothetical protein